MKPINFPEANLELGKPNGMTDAECGLLHAFTGVDHNNRPFVNSMWQPSLDDIKAVLAGRPVMMSIMIHPNHVPPASVFTYNKEGQYNEKDYDAEEMAKIKELLNGLGEIEAQTNRAYNILNDISPITSNLDIAKALDNNKKLIEFIRAFYEG